MVGRRWVLGILVVLILGLVVAGVALAATPHYAQRTCSRCHDSKAFVAATARSPHSSVPCTSCHGGGSVANRITFTSDQVFGMWLRLDTLDATTKSVSSEACASCHSNLRLSNNNGMRILHGTCTVGRECTDCHSTTAHGRATTWPKSTDMQMCYECHGAGNAPTACDTCHEGKLPNTRIKTGTFAVTHGPNYRKTHGMGDMKTCVACHNSGDCAKCHGGGVPHSAAFVSTHGDIAKSRSAKCTSCHRASFCADCHGFVMPHPKSFTQSHSKLVKRDGQTECERCHVTSDCQRCHEAHVHPTTTEQMKSFRFDDTVGGAK